MADAIPHDISIKKAIVVGIWLESVFWGIYTGLMVLCVWVFKFRRRHLRGGVLAGVVTMYILATVHCMLEMQRLLNGFVNHNGDIKILTTSHTPSPVCRMVIYALNNSLSDAVVVWRCIVVWQRDWRACFLPVLLLLATTINGLYFASLFRGLTADDRPYAMQVHTNGIVFFALSLATNFITTSLVAGRIWWLSHKVYVPGLSTGRYNAVVAMLIESGILYSSIKVCELVLWVLSSNAFFIVFASMAQIMCITPTAIFIFVALGIVDSGQQFQTMDPTGRSVAGGGAISGASFRFARPFTTTFPRSNTVGSINGPSLPIASYAGAKRPSVVDFKVSADDTVVDGRHSGSSKMKDVSEHSSFEERKSVRSFVVDDEVERDLERQDGEIQQQPCHRRVEGLHQRRESTQTDTPTLHVPPTSSDAIHATGIVP